MCSPNTLLEKNYILHCDWPSPWFVSGQSLSVITNQWAMVYFLSSSWNKPPWLIPPQYNQSGADIISTHFTHPHEYSEWQPYSRVLLVTHVFTYFAPTPESELSCILLLYCKIIFPRQNRPCSRGSGKHIVSGGFYSSSPRSKLLTADQIKENWRELKWSIDNKLPGIMRLQNKRSHSRT